MDRNLFLVAILFCRCQYYTTALGGGCWPAVWRPIAILLAIVAKRRTPFQYCLPSPEAAGRRLVLVFHIPPSPSHCLNVCLFTRLESVGRRDNTTFITSLYGVYADSAGALRDRSAIQLCTAHPNHSLSLSLVAGSLSHAQHTHTSS